MSVRITRSSIALGLCLLSGCIAFNEFTLRSESQEDISELLSKMLNEEDLASSLDNLADGMVTSIQQTQNINDNQDYRLFVGGCHIPEGVIRLVSVMNNQPLGMLGSGDYSEVARIEAIRQLVEFSKTEEAKARAADNCSSLSEKIQDAIVRTYTHTATDNMKQEILKVFDTPEMYSELISKGGLDSVSDGKDWTPTTTPVYATSNYSRSNRSSKEMFFSYSSDWVAVFEACPSQAQWSALFDEVTKWRIETLQERGYGVSLNISRLSEIYDKIKQPTYEQKYAALVLLNSFSRNTIYVLDRKEPEYKTYIRSVSDAQKKALSSMPKNEVLQLLKDLEPFRKKNIAFDRLYIWVWLKRVATHQQRADFAKAETDALNQAKQQALQEIAQEKAQRKIRAAQWEQQVQQELAQKEAQRKARKEKDERDRKTRVVIYCNICECEREDNKRSAMEWQRNSKTVEEANEEAKRESFDGDYGGTTRITATECDYCPHLPSFHRIVEQ